MMRIFLNKNIAAKSISITTLSSPWGTSTYKKYTDDSYAKLQRYVNYYMAEQYYEIFKNLRGNKSEEGTYHSIPYFVRYPY